jgi:hypothetical protein
MKYLVLASTLLLSGCVQSLLVVKAVQVHQGNSSYVKCIVQASDKLKSETRAKADDLCKDVQKEFLPPGVTPSK